MTLHLRLLISIDCRACGILLLYSRRVTLPSLVLSLLLKHVVSWLRHICVGFSRLAHAISTCVVRTQQSSWRIFSYDNILRVLWLRRSVHVGRSFVKKVLSRGTLLIWQRLLLTLCMCGIRFSSLVGCYTSLGIVCALIWCRVLIVRYIIQVADLAGVRVVVTWVSVTTSSIWPTLSINIKLIWEPFYLPLWLFLLLTSISARLSVSTYFPDTVYSAHQVILCVSVNWSFVRASRILHCYRTRNAFKLRLLLCW